MSTEYRLLVDVGTAVIADVFDGMGRTPLVVDNSLFPVSGGDQRFVGPAYTVAGETFRWSGGGDRDKLEAIDKMSSGVVAVWAGGDIRGVCCFGDLLATAMKSRGVVGAVVDGGVRDVAFLKSLQLPVVARYRTPAQAIGRWHVTARQVPVQVRGALQDWIAINPGDVVVGDEDGIIAVPRETVGEVLGRIAAWSQKDSSARDEIAKGMPLLDALDKYGHL